MYIFPKKTIKDVDLKGKRVIVRVDYNVPLNEDGSIADDYRIVKSLPTLRYLIEQGCKITLMSHLGRPKGKVIASLSLGPVAVRLRELLPDTKISFVADCIGPEASKASAKLGASDVLLLENTRYHSADEENDPEFASELATYGDIFVQDCFGVAHRSHASITGVSEHLPSVAGLLVEEEVVTINSAMQSPEKPFAAVIGGAKISDKIGVLKRMVETADFVAVVGAMANTFLIASGKTVGKSLAAPEDIPLAKEIMDIANTRSSGSGFELYLPQDYVVSTEIDGTKETRIVDMGSNTYADISNYPSRPTEQSMSVADNEMILDVGPVSASYIAGVLSTVKTAVWNGTAGVTETKGIGGAADPFEHGTRVFSSSLTRSNGPYTIVGGGDTVSYVESVPGMREKLDHVSTGGGASMELMSGKELPGVEVLDDKES